jgi:hypothetical protein
MGAVGCGEGTTPPPNTMNADGGPDDMDNHGLAMQPASPVFALTADAAATVDVPMGQCLTENPEPAEGAHPILGEVMAVACPGAP